MKEDLKSRDAQLKARIESVRDNADARRFRAQGGLNEHEKVEVNEILKNIEQEQLKRGKSGASAFGALLLPEDKKIEKEEVVEQGVEKKEEATRKLSEMTEEESLEEAANLTDEEKIPEVDGLRSDSDLEALGELREEDDMSR